MGKYRDIDIGEVLEEYERKLREMVDMLIRCDGGVGGVRDDGSLLDIEFRILVLRYLKGGAPLERTYYGGDDNE